ncbi:oxidoreductase [Metabacillus litoralis]|uniref:oxidoreductase n=1 Tax=Metabacillus litoralis TaxID=152268 RepID=UPI001CFE2E7E|nr:oxidoreductase [Metabacillus litoralis]
MRDRIAVITGASSGFGLLTSIEFASNDYTVIATMRDLTKSKHLISEANSRGVADKIHTHELDVTSNQSVQKLKNYLMSLGRIDVLVNNAGYAGAGFVEEIPIDEYRRQFETNLFGAINVTQAVLPLMRQQKSGKIINVSSISGKVGFPGLSPYVSSKYALEGWSESLRLEMKSFGVDVVLVEPGSFQTNIWSSGKHVTKKSLQKESPYFETMKMLENHIMKGNSTFGDARDVAKLITEVSQKKSPSLRYTIGKGVKLTILLKSIMPWKIWEKVVLKQLK